MHPSSQLGNLGTMLSLVICIIHHNTLLRLEGKLVELNKPYPPVPLYYSILSVSVKRILKKSSGMRQYAGVNVQLHKMYLIIFCWWRSWCWKLYRQYLLWSYWEVCLHKIKRNLYLDFWILSVGVKPLPSMTVWKLHCTFRKMQHS